jgi:hypothetical protein
MNEDLGRIMGDLRHAAMRYSNDAGTERLADEDVLAYRAAYLLLRPGCPWLPRILTAVKREDLLS